MQQWEYLFVNCAYEDNDWHPHSTNGVLLAEGRKWAEMTVHDFSNEVGQRGWELVSLMTGHSQRGSTEVYRLVFKRPLSA